MRKTVLVLASLALAVLSASGVALVSASAPTSITKVGMNAKPNLLVVMIDDADLETYRDVPRLDAMTKGEGVYFNNSFVSDPLCCPSRATFLRGQYSHNHGVFTNTPPYGGYKRFQELGRGKDNLATRLDEAGYTTIMVGKYLNGFQCKNNVPPGWDSFRFVDKKGQYWHNGACHDLPKGTWYDDLIGSKAASAIRKQAQLKRPFFAWVSFHSPHWLNADGFSNYKYDPPDRYMGTREDAHLAPNPTRPEEDLSDKPQWVRDRVAHYGITPNATLENYHQRRVEMLKGIADNMKKMLSALRQTDQLDNTYIVFTDDNGFLMGEHSINGKLAPYEGSIRVPLAIRGPGIPQGVVREQFVLNNDLAPTLLNWAGLALPEYMDGRALQPLLEANAPSSWRDHVLIERGGPNMPLYEMLRTQRYAYVEYPTGERELYDMLTDPYQEQNVYGQRPDVEAELATGLDALRNCKGQECRDAEDTPLP